MECLICNEPVSDIDTGGDFVEITCPKCGHYRVTRTALALMEAHDWHFNLEQTREWIVSQQSAESVPTIDSQLVSVLIQS